MSEERLTIQFEIIDANVEIQLIDMLMQVSTQFDDVISDREKRRAVNYFYEWFKDLNPSIGE